VATLDDGAVRSADVVEVVDVGDLDCQFTAPQQSCDAFENRPAFRAFAEVDAVDRGLLAPEVGRVRLATARHYRNDLASVAQDLEVGFEVFAEHVVQDHVDTGLAGDSPDLRGQGVARVFEGTDGTQGPNTVTGSVRACRRDDVGTRAGGELHRHVTDTARAPVDEDPVTGLSPATDSSVIQAVAPTFPMAPSTSKETDSGRWATFQTGMAAYSAVVPPSA